MSSLKRKSEGPLASGDGNKKAKVNSSITSFFGAPKSSPGAPASSPSSSANVNANANANDTAPLSWNKDKWVASLTLEQKKHLQLEIQTLDPSWLQHLREEITSPEFINLKKFLENEVKAGKKVFPPRNDVYSWYVYSFTFLPTYLPTCVCIYAGNIYDLHVYIYQRSHAVNSAFTTGRATRPSAACDA